MTDYPKPSLTADAVVLSGSGDDMQLLVIERARDPYCGRFALPGGFLDPYEHPLTAACRELEEETGLSLPIQDAVPLSMRAKKGRDPRGWTVTQPFLFHLSQVRSVHAGDDAARAEWVRLADLETLAFDHGAVLNEALGRFWSHMPTMSPRLTGVIPFGGSGPTDRVAFFGGSFNPWHQGHLQCVRSHSDPERVVVVPDSNPRKTGPDTRCYWSDYRSLCKQVNGAAVFPGFHGMETPNPTAGWLPRTHYKHRTLIIGDDSLATFPHWIQARELAQSLDVLHVLRRDADAAAVKAACDWLSTVSPKTSLIEVEDNPFHNLSSTQMRNSSSETQT